MATTIRHVSRILAGQIWQLRRHLSGVSTPEKTYADTLLLPKTSFPLRAHPSIREAPFREKTSENLYKWQWEHSKGPLFVLHDGPPYANGSLHMGHALNKILKDMINRYNVLLGHKVHYVPGWDCHGLPIENKALQTLGADHRSISTSHIRAAARQTAEHEINIQKEEFRTLGIMADWTSEDGCYRTLDHNYEIRQLRIFKALVEKDLIYRQYRPVHYSPSSRSALAEAELTYVDNHPSKSVYVAFDAVLDGVTEDFRDVMARCGSELKIKFLVWTTTPWTLPTNMGIAVHSELDYGLVTSQNTEGLIVVGRDRLPHIQHVLGDTSVLHTFKGSELLACGYTPIFRAGDNAAKSLPLIHANHVTAASGTGLVHCAPAHGSEDYQTFIMQNLLSHGTNGDTRGVLCLVGPDGTFSEGSVRTATWLDDTVGARLAGRRVLEEGNLEVISLLREKGMLVKEELIKHRYPYDWKTNSPIIVTATSQWFADLRFIKQEALDILQTVEFYPETARNRLESFIRDRSEWCISRQRPWGVPITALHDELTGEAILTSDSLDYIIGILETKGVEHWWSGPVEDFISPILKRDRPNAKWAKGVDTMDVWFDSGTSWATLPNSPLSKNGDTPEAALADVCLEGSDQHRGWFQSLLLTTAGFSSQGSSASVHHKQRDSSGGQVSLKPYGTLITHGFVLDQEGKKMSKSAGNVTSPMTIVKGGKILKKDPAHGADVLRLWAATVEYGRDTSVGPVVIQQTVESLRKFRNTARFMLGNLRDVILPHQQPDIDLMSIADRYVMFELYQLEKTAKEAYAGYRFPQVVAALNRFAKITLSSLYFDVTKDTLYADARESVKRKSIIWVMEQVLTTLKIIMAPILPHLSEELHHVLRGSPSEITNDQLSVFADGWKYVGEKWNDHTVEQEMTLLLDVRRSVTGLLEEVRTEKLIRNSLEASVDIIVPNDLNMNGLPNVVKLIQEQESFLKTLFIVSDVQILDEGSLGVDSPLWSRSVTMELDDLDNMINIRVRPAELQKCPRCWTYSREDAAELCPRCKDVLQQR